MAFKNTLMVIMRKEKVSAKDVAGIMGVHKSQVYRYLNGSIKPQWETVLLLFEGLGYDLKITKKK